MDIALIHQIILERKKEYLKFVTIANSSTDSLQIMMAEFKVKKILPQIERILEVISKGRYGLCIECGEKISDKRMKIVQLAIRCIDCQTSEEKKASLRK